MGQFPTVLAGATITTTLLDNMIPLTAFKPSDQSVTSSTALVNDTALVLPMAATATYIFLSYIDYEGGTQGSSDLQFQWTVPAAAVMKFVPIWLGTGGAQNFGHDTASQIIVAGTNAAGVSRGVIMLGSVQTIGTSGNLQLQWAQNTSNATPTKVHQGSWVGLIETS